MSTRPPARNGSQASSAALTTAVDLIELPLHHRGKVRELYDLGESYLIVVTDRISAFDHVLRPAVPGKGRVLNELSRFWFAKTAPFQPNHMIHSDVRRLGDVVVDVEALDGRVMVVSKAQRIDVECVVRGHLTGGAWRQYQRSGAVNGIELPQGLRKNQRLPQAIFTPARKVESGHDEDVSFAELVQALGVELAGELKNRSMQLYDFLYVDCKRKGVILADSKFEFGLIGGELVLIDELCTPDSSRFWAQERFALNIEIDSMDKEPVRTFLARSGWDFAGEPDPLPDEVVAATARRYAEILERLTKEDS